jgi:DNA-binding IclR family transcriptional regulator
MTKSAIRALSLLELLAERARPLSHGEISEAMALPKSSLTELLSAMMARRYIRRSGDSGDRFALGPGVLPLASLILRQNDIVRLAQPVLNEMMQATGESTSLAMRVGREVVAIARVNSHQPVAYSLPVGQRGPLHATAAGKAMLGVSSLAERERYLAETPLAAMTVRTITDPATLHAELETISKGAVAIVDEELFDGVVTLGLAIRDADGHPVASLTIGMPAMRATQERRALAERVLRQGTAEISSALGWNRSGSLIRSGRVDAADDVARAEKPGVRTEIDAPARS